MTLLEPAPQTFFFLIGKNNIIEKRLRRENKHEVA